MDRQVASILLLAFAAESVSSHFYLNYTGDLAGRQIWDFVRKHPVPIGLHTTSSGQPVEIRSIQTINSDLYANQYHLDVQSHFGGERIPERVAYAKGLSAFGYFEVTQDVSKYTSANVFNDIGKKTQVVIRFSIAGGNLGVSELGQDNRGQAIRFYTKEGNLDVICNQVPVAMIRDPLDFPSFIHALKRNPRTNLLDPTMAWDFITLRPAAFHGLLWIQSDYGSPDGYRKMDTFAIHTYELSNRDGEKFYAKLNFRTEQGLANLTSAENMAITPLDPDYFKRDLYNAISEKNYPVWRLELDIMTEEDVKKANYNPFDVTVLWKKGTYRTVSVGKLVLDKTVNNNFADSEQAAYNPGNLVPGIPGPIDYLFKSRRLSYKNTHNHRLGFNHNKIEVNMPKYAKNYNHDGSPPVRDNMNGVPVYYPNSYNGPMPYVDESLPKQKLLVLESNAVDFSEPAYFYNHVLNDDAQRQRLANNLASSLQSVIPNVARRGLKMLNDIDKDLGKHTAVSLRELKHIAMHVSDEERRKRNTQCFERNPLMILKKY